MKPLVTRKSALAATAMLETLVVSKECSERLLKDAFLKSRVTPGLVKLNMKAILERTDLDGRADRGDLVREREN